MNAVSRIAVWRTIVCPFSVAQEYAEDFFTAAVRDVTFSVPFQKLVPSLGARLRGSVKLGFREPIDIFGHGRRHDALAIVWSGESMMFADFRGTLELRIASITTTKATLQGHYRPRFGILGAVFDRVFGHRVAETMLQTLMDSLADALEHREARYRAAEGAAVAGGL
jgi:hypothetical protein